MRSQFCRASGVASLDCKLERGQSSAVPKGKRGRGARRGAQELDDAVSSEQEAGNPRGTWLRK